MLIVESPNSWSCMPAAFATATGIPLDTLLESIGHDGSEIIFPDLEDPLCRRTFNTQEIAFALFQFEWLVTTYDVNWISIVDDDHAFEVTPVNASTLLEPIMRDSIGVVAGIVKTTGNRHAAAWDGRLLYDPSGFIYVLDRFKIESYFRLSKIPILE